MSRDVEKHCSECQVCQQSKLPHPTQAPLVSVPIGNPLQMVAVDNYSGCFCNIIYIKATATFLSSKIILG